MLLKEVEVAQLAVWFQHQPDQSLSDIAHPDSTSHIPFCSPNALGLYRNRKPILAQD